MGLLISIVAPTVLNRADEARIQKAQADFKAIETALKIYRLDNYVYPTTEQGLEALVSPSSIDPQPRNFKDGGYLAQLPMDPWGRPYLYLSPGDNGEVDIYTLGADGLAGGEGQNADIGNWRQDEG
jgi:general secretion pathway protein G